MQKYPSLIEALIHHTITQFVTYTNKLWERSEVVKRSIIRHHLIANFHAFGGLIKRKKQAEQKTKIISCE